MIKNSKTRFQANSNIITNFVTDEVFADLFARTKTQSIKEGEIVSGTIIKIDNDFATVDVGTKNEGVIPLKEFADEGVTPELSVGDIVEVFIEKIENRYGKTILSREKAIREKYWLVLENALNKGQTVNGTIFGKVKGGFTVDLNGIVAFLPGSQVDIKPIKDISPLLGILQPFHILKIDREQGNVVVSRRAILEGSREEARSELLANIKENQILDGVVKNVTDYGAFIDLGSVDGLLHVTDISWSKINHPSEVLSIGQVVKVKVIKFNEETKRISLGMKQLESNPWVGIEAKYPKGSRNKGKITNITDYGVFIELEPGIEGLVHISEVSWTKNNFNPKKFVNVGQDVEFIVLEVDSSKHRISLGMKQCIINPWDEFLKNNPVGSVVEGTIKNIVDFGIFVGFENDDLDGLVHLSDLDWNEDPEVLKNYVKEQKVSVKVLSVDIEKERISLGVKQLSEDPSVKVVSKYKKGAVVSGKVIEVNQENILVELDEETKGIIKKQELSAEKNEAKTELFEVGNLVECKVLSYDNPTKLVVLSIRALEKDTHKKVMAEYSSNEASTSLGALFAEALNK